jgi:hypothetical protein
VQPAEQVIASEAEVMKQVLAPVVALGVPILWWHNPPPYQGVLRGCMNQPFFLRLMLRLRHG